MTNFLKFLRRMLHTAGQPRRRVRGVLFAGLAVFITSVTIASIPSAPSRLPSALPAAIVPADLPPDAAQSQPAPRMETRVTYVSGNIETNLFEDGHEAGLSEALILKLVEIFGWDVDFALNIRRGDSFAVIHEEKYWLGQKVADGQILAAEFVNQGKPYRAIARRDASGFTHYFTPEGMGLQRMFLRTPVKYTRISSRYTDTASRFHPILKTWTAHRGVDYAAPAGTPVRATATGRIFSLGRDGGYGHSIVIRHAGVYSTLYAHLARYQPGLRAGSYVEQGQIIGYVGSTGLATGPHLHYEFQVQGAHRNPLNFHFPGAAPIAAEYRDDFQRHARVWTAQLDRITPQVQIAANK
jgi:murein DD-endopeptidase MepM/ murein hydrolase activator NlpD